MMRRPGAALRGSVSLLLILFALGLAACSTGRRLVSETAEVSQPAVIEVQTGAQATASDVLADVDVDAPAVTEPVFFRRGAYPANSLCGLPCEAGCATWNVGVVGGAGFYLGDEATERACCYTGADVGRTWPCCCFGASIFYRTFGGRFDRVVTAPGAPARTGADTGRFHTIGVKATYQRSINNSRWSWYVGAGPEFFWTHDYLANDDGIGGFGEAGVGYRLTRKLSIRGGLEVHALSTSAARLNAANDNSKRLLWVLAPVLQLQFSL